jgi:amino acid adenylation domain-containing protein
MKESTTASTILEMIKKSVCAAPFDTAVLFNGNGATYLELDERSSQLGNYLVEQGVSKGSVIGVSMERSIETVITLLGIMKAGAAYLPLDDNNPIHRNKYIVDNSGIPFVITQGSFSDKLRGAGIKAVNIDEWQYGIKKCAVSEPKTAVSGEDIAYVMYTSGSTGMPKGVVIRHKSVANVLGYLWREIGVSKNDKLLAVATYTFDISVLDFFLPLMAGATLVIADKETALDGMKLKNALINQSITVMQATPATWRMLIDSAWEGSKTFKILCGGEAWTRRLADMLLPKCEALWNLYGPTETTIWSAVNRIKPGNGNITLGAPVPDTSFYLLDEKLRPVQKGDEGELYIGGIGLAKGYLNNKPLTDERFILNPFEADNGKLYKTGDLVKYNKNGELEYVGRTDFQVKIRGYRIELEEIEKLAEGRPAIEQAVEHVISGTEQEDKRIVLFYKEKYPVNGIIKELASVFTLNLPGYMVPSSFIKLDSFPLNLNGKVDRKVLEEQYSNKLPVQVSEGPPLDASANQTDGDSDIEKRLTAIWSNLLGVDDIMAHESFLELGGHSLMANKLTLKINDEFGTTLSLKDILTGELTIAAQTAQIEDNLISQLSADEIEELLVQLEYEAV